MSENQPQGATASTRKAFNTGSPELTQKINDTIAASGLQDKEWIEQVTNLWIMQQMKEGTPDFKKDIGELELHTRRINELVVNMVQRSAFEKQEVERKSDEMKVQKNEIIEGYQTELSEIKKQIKGFEDEASLHREQKERAEGYARQLEETAKNNRLLIQEYQEKNDTLTGLVNEYKEGFDESKALREQVAGLTQKTERLEADLAREQQLAAERQAAHVESNRQLEERHKEEIERIIERKDIEKERALLQLRTEMQNKLQEANEASTAKIQGLYERIEQIRKEYEQSLQESKEPKAKGREKNPQ